MPQPTRFGRVPRQKIIWEQSEVLDLSAKPKKGSKRQVQTLQTRPASPNDSAVVRELAAEPQPQFNPPIQVAEEPFQMQWIEQEPLNLFLRFFGGFESLEIVCAATNARAESQESTTSCGRLWSSVQPTEFLQWLGILFYMGHRRESTRDSYWQQSERGTGHHMGFWMSHTRWDQIHRHLTFNNQPTNRTECFWAPVEPIASTIRENCQNAVKPSTWVAVDEGMIGFSGRSKHIVNIASKPTSEGYKVWILALKEGYTFSWRWHSRITGPESIGKTPRWFPQPDGMPPIQLAPTFQVVQILCQELRNKYPDTKYVVFVDNLFTTIGLAHTLLKIDIGIMGTTRKNHANFPQRFIAVKKSDANFTYGSCSTEILGHCLCFLWQDNAPVIGITTAFAIPESPEGYIVRTRARPTNNAVAALVFGDEAEKDLPIPKAIDYYNHNHNLVDVADQLRHPYRVERQWETRTWRPLVYWLFDVCLVNSFLFWRRQQSEDDLRDHHSHRGFRERLFDQICAYREPSPTPPLTPRRTRCLSNHVPTVMNRRSFCAWGLQNITNCLGTRVMSLRKKRKPLGAISGNARDNRDRVRPRLTKFGCQLCKVNICVKEGCFAKFHASKSSS